VNLRLASAALLSADVVKALNPQSPETRAIFDLAIVTGIVMVVIFAVVVGIVAYALLCFPRWRDGERDPERGQGTKSSKSYGPEYRLPLSPCFSCCPRERWASRIRRRRRNRTLC